MSFYTAHVQIEIFRPCTSDAVWPIVLPTAKKSNKIGIFRLYNHDTFKYIYIKLATFVVGGL